MSNREERERLRQQRLAQQKNQGSSDRRRLLLGYVTAGLLAAAVLAGLVAVIASGGDDGNGGGGGDIPANAHVQAEVGSFEGLDFDDREGTAPPELQFGDLEESAQMAGCETMLNLPDEGSSHFGKEDEGTYKTNPPTSGDHFASPTEAGSGATADGAYTTKPPESRLVHAMEHGRVEVRYDPTLPEDQQLALKGVFDEDPDGMILVPDPDLAEADFVVAVSAWTNAVGCPAYDPLVLDVVRNFRDTFRGNGPEDVPISF
jgi:Protein of unknown function (DUF3105)